MAEKRIATLSNAAIRYAEKGWRVFPLISNIKKPLIKGWPNQATTNSKQIQQWWTNNPNVNIGIVTGPSSGILVIDIDVKNNIDGMHSFIELCGDHGIPDTRMARSPSGGYHYYFLLPKGCAIRNRVSFRPNFDIRGQGGYIVAPPSVIGEASYLWVDESVEIIELPSWLQELLEERSSPGTAQETVSLDTVSWAVPGDDLSSSNSCNHEGSSMISTASSTH